MKLKEKEDCPIYHSVQKYLFDSLKKYRLSSFRRWREKLAMVDCIAYKYSISLFCDYFIIKYRGVSFKHLPPCKKENKI